MIEGILRRDFTRNKSSRTLRCDEGNSRRRNNHGKDCKPSNCSQAPEMKFGVCVPNYGETCSSDAIQQVAAAAEEGGYDSVWCTDHVLLPKRSEERRVGKECRSQWR